MALNTPILFVIFNRPDRATRVFAEIKKAKPKYLYIAADGPRPNKPGEKELCAEARQVVDNIDWNCEVIKDFSDINLGCSERVYSGINRILAQHDRAIILEDDCLPNQSFFLFCEEMLEKYKDNQKIMMLSGINIAGEWKKDTQDYHFSIYGGVWGWATWQRAWKLYDPQMTNWPKREARSKIKKIIGDPKQYWARKSLFNIGYHKKSWEYQWAFARTINNGLSIVPAVNLIANIGFGADATHTKEELPILGHLKPQEINFPLRGNPDIRADVEYDKKFFEALHPEFRHSWPIIILIKIWHRITPLLKI
jgi:hypothetical protein